MPPEASRTFQSGVSGYDQRTPFFWDYLLQIHASYHTVRPLNEYVAHITSDQTLQPAIDTYLPRYACNTECK
jgi:hypothetical protein